VHSASLSVGNNSDERGVSSWNAAKLALLAPQRHSFFDFFDKMPNKSKPLLVQKSKQASTDFRFFEKNGSPSRQAAAPLNVMHV